MSRHRDVRSMNYSEEYDGYDDVYGHSIEDDYLGVSPSVEPFLYDRSRQQNIASFITEPDIVEDNEDIDEPLPSSDQEKHNLSELERAKLISCLETIRNVIGDTMPDSNLKEKIILSNFDANTALDAILKESSPKKDSAMNDKRLEQHPDVSINKSSTSMFTIPRFSFKEEHNLAKDSAWTIYQPNDINRSKNVNHSFQNFPSLAEHISHHTEFINSDTTKISQNVTNVQKPFGSLAALTTNYLQKSNAANNIETREKHQSPLSQFVIPKLSIEKRDSEETKNVHLSKFHINETNKSQLVSTNISGKHDIDLLRKDFSNMDIFPKNNTRNIKSEEQLKNPRNEICNPLSDEWVDLSTALKEAEFLADSTFCNTNLSTSGKLYRNTHNLDTYLEDDDRITPDPTLKNILPVTLNLYALRSIKFPYTKKNVSVFGKTLCKKWKMKKPVLKAIVQHYNTVIPFDFSIPYRNSNRS